MTHPGVYLLNTGNRTIPISVTFSNEADVRVILQRRHQKTMGRHRPRHGDDTLPSPSQDRFSNDWEWPICASLIFAGLECFLALHSATTSAQTPPRQPPAARQPDAFY